MNDLTYSTFVVKIKICISIIFHNLGTCINYWLASGNNWKIIYYSRLINKINRFACFLLILHIFTEYHRQLSLHKKIKIYLHFSPLGVCPVLYEKRHASVTDHQRLMLFYNLDQGLHSMCKVPFWSIYTWV